MIGFCTTVLGVGYCIPFHVNRLIKDRSATTGTRMPFFSQTYVTRVSFTAQINRTAVTGVSLSMLKLTEPDTKHKNNITLSHATKYVYIIEEKQYTEL